MSVFRGFGIRGESCGEVDGGVDVFCCDLPIPADPAIIPAINRPAATPMRTLILVSFAASGGFPSNLLARIGCPSALLFRIPDLTKARMTLIMLLLFAISQEEKLLTTLKRDWHNDLVRFIRHGLD